jgi:hypothetical protein
LRAITGWSELGFDRDGALMSGSKIGSPGSPASRELIARAVNGDIVIVLEDASNRQDVVFSRIVPGRWIKSSHDDPPAYVMLIDFADFDHLIGDKVALRAFDVGWGFLHELDHVRNESADTETLHDTGECEAHINQMRRECNLPLRTEYLYTYFPRTEQSEFRTRFVRLAFDHQDATNAKHRRYWVMWDATLVGGLGPFNTLAKLKN